MLPFVTADDLRVTADDLTELNRSVLVRTARLGRVLGTVLIAIGALGGVFWIWVVWRQQNLIGDDNSPFNFGLDDADLSARLDVFATTFSFITSAALTAGLGMVLRVAGEYVVAEKGGSLTAVEVGDPFPTATDDLPWLADDEDDSGDRTS